MNEYLKAFQLITQSTEQLLADSDKSQEVKRFAGFLKAAVTPCFDELKQSATRLKNLVQVGFEQLTQAEDVWNSKLRIADAPTTEILEQLGDISARHFRIRRLGSQFKTESVTQAKKSWKDIRLASLKNKWFIDKKGNPKRKIRLGKKDGFIKELRHELELQDSDIKNLLIESLSLIYKELESIHFNLIQECVGALNTQEQAEQSQKLEVIVGEIERKLGEPSQELFKNAKSFKEAVSPLLDDLLKQGLLSIQVEQVDTFKEKVAGLIENIIIPIVDDRVKLATSTLDQAILFYDDFLERQGRYQQESPEQRSAEKAWIDTQRQELDRVKSGIDAILR